MNLIGEQKISKNNQVITSLNLTEDENCILAGTVELDATITIPSGSTVVIIWARLK